jgi:membrane associated rhomboid family serine protease
MRAGRPSGWIEGGDSEPERRPSGFPQLTSAVKVLLWINIGVYLANFVLNDALTPVMALWPSRAEANPLIGALQLVSHQFLHAYNSPFHLIFNMLMFYFLGTLLEGSIGPRRLVWLYLMSGVVGGIFWILFCWFAKRDLTMAGASGAVYGIMVYAACLAPRMEVFLLVFRMRLWALAAIFVGIAFYMVVVQLRTDAISSVADAGHLGGAVYGFLAFRTRAWGVGSRIRARMDDLARSRQRAGSRRLDAILEKIKRSGMTSLSFFERRFLVRQSRKRGPR